jgi:hypothetical protein
VFCARSSMHSLTIRSAVVGLFLAALGMAAVESGARAFEDRFMAMPSARAAGLRPEPATPSQRSCIPIVGEW